MEAMHYKPTVLIREILRKSIIIIPKEDPIWIPDMYDFAGIIGVLPSIINTKNESNEIVMPVHDSSKDIVIQNEQVMLTETEPRERENETKTEISRNSLKHEEQKSLNAHNETSRATETPRIAGLFGTGYRRKK